MLEEICVAKEVDTKDGDRKKNYKI